MTPEEFFHDHPVIDEQEDDGIALHFHDLPPLLLKNPIILPDDDPPPDEDDPPP